MGKAKQALVMFHMDGQQYGFIMPAESREDAERRLQAIKFNGHIQGWPCYAMSANALTLPFVALWVHVLTWWKNLTGAKE